MRRETDGIAQNTGTILYIDIKEDLKKVKTAQYLWKRRHPYVETKKTYTRN